MSDRLCRNCKHYVHGVVVRGKEPDREYWECALCVGKQIKDDDCCDMWEGQHGQWHEEGQELHCVYVPWIKDDSKKKGQDD